MTKIGIWTDKRRAHIVSLKKDTESLTTLASDIEEYHPKGGSGSRQKGGPQDVVQDSKYLNREKQQFAAFFKRVVEEVNDAEEIVIIGPAETGEKLYAEMRDKYPQTHAKTSQVLRADNMTDKQLVAWFKKYFE